jgi:hypothetical protein
MKKIPSNSYFFSLFMTNNTLDLNSFHIALVCAYNMLGTISLTQLARKHETIGILSPLFFYLSWSSKK